MLERNKPQHIREGEREGVEERGTHGKGCEHTRNRASISDQLRWQEEKERSIFIT